jgi:riboflavin biosynthesis pyrimidine reductase
MAISANGIIARENNEEDFLSNDNWKVLVELLRKSKCLIWGAKTYSLVKEWGGDYLDTIKEAQKIIVSDKDIELDEGFVLAHSPQDALEKAKAEGFTEVIVSGGSTLNASFAKAGLIDAVIFNIEPVIVGEGIPVFAREDFDLPLEFQDVQKLDNGLLQIRYTVKK